MALPEMVARLRRKGRTTRSVGPIIRAAGSFGVGEICSITRMAQEPLLAEVIGFVHGEMLLAPYGTPQGISYNSIIMPSQSRFEVPVGEELLGRVLNAWGDPIDGGGSVGRGARYPAYADAPNPMTRPLIDTPFVSGIRAIDGVLTCGEGQRMGIFAAAGGGKSTLISMLARNANCDRCVIALIGERGREVREFIDYQLGPDGMARSIVVVATSDRPVIEQVKAAYSATAIAEFFRDQGEHVLFIMDSLTRFARAQRQLGLSAGEPPTRRGFPPSVFEQLPGLLERSGRSEHGTITAFYTVLVEGDDMNEPVADEARSLLDGHIILSRKLAGAGHYPAIDTISSASRVITNIVTGDHLQAVRKLRALLSKYTELELLVRIGEYISGTDQLGDEALERIDSINAFLQQEADAVSYFDETIANLKWAVGND
ncbi:FliI/YscN family ATPase [Phyllobacterium salinisoli]|uniref:FliI/YscN family ATPase n=2 Tax=Phyllobacterium salinisoli TaxID=1899321 RepID=A0A368JX82_9HYPH|nr:FliI/YscN family ATPase [Phyllobacterium salinisoli]